MSLQVPSFIDVITSRRSIRKFTSDPIPNDVIEQCLNWAMLAPNSSNLQPWEFHRVINPGKKKRLVEACLNQAAAATAQELIVCVARTNTWRRNAKQILEQFEAHKAKGGSVPQQVFDYYKKLVPFVYTQGPLGIFGLFKFLIASLVGIFKPIPREPFGTAALKTWAVKSAALGCENLMLSIKSYGYDSCPMEGMDSKRVKKIIGRCCGAEIVMVLGVGKAAPDGLYGPQLRLDSKQFVFRHD